MLVVESSSCFLGGGAVECEVAGRTYVRMRCVSHLEAFDWSALIADGFGTVMFEGVSYSGSVKK